MDFFDRIESYYARNGISTNQFTHHSSTEEARDQMVYDFAEKMLDVEAKLKVAVEALESHNCVYTRENGDNCHLCQALEKIKAK